MAFCIELFIENQIKGKEKGVKKIVKQDGEREIDRWIECKCMIKIIITNQVSLQNLFITSRYIHIYDELG